MSSPRRRDHIFSRKPGAITPKDLVLSALSGILLVLAFPKFGLDAVAWISLVPLLLALEGKTLRSAFFLSYLTGLIFFSGVFYWIWTAPGFNLLDYAIVMIAYLPHYFSLWAVAVVWIRGRTGLPIAWIGPPLWVSFEYLRVHASFLSAPGMLLGHSQYLHPSLVQLSSITGVYGLSFLIMLVNATVTEGIRAFQADPQRAEASHIWRSPLVALSVAGFLLGGSVLYGNWVLTTFTSSTSSPTTKIAIIQGNIPQDVKWDKPHREGILAHYSDLTRRTVLQSSPDLIIWPETAIPGDLLHERSLQVRISELARDVRTPLLVGSSEYAKFTNHSLKQEYYNSMVLLSSKGEVRGYYRKMILFPFGEYDPLKGRISWPKAIADAMGEMIAGEDYSLLRVKDLTFGTVICWEVIYPDHFRTFVRRGAQFLISATNEAWFGDTAAPYQLLSITVFRAAENRVPIARAANTGLSAFIDQFGKITSSVRGDDGKELFVEGVLLGNISPSGTRTLYTEYGDVLAFVQIAISVFLIFGSLLKKNAEYINRVVELKNKGEEPCA